VAEVVDVGMVQAGESSEPECCRHRAGNRSLSVGARPAGKKPMAVWEIHGVAESEEAALARSAQIAVP